MWIEYFCIATEHFLVITNGLILENLINVISFKCSNKGIRRATSRPPTRAGAPLPQTSSQALLLQSSLTRGWRTRTEPRMLPERYWTPTTETGTGTLTASRWSRWSSTPTSPLTGSSRPPGQIFRAISRSSIEMGTAESPFKISRISASST